MKKLCVKYFKMGAQEFFPNQEYKIEYNPLDSQFYIYNVWCYQVIHKWMLDTYFL